MAICLSCDSVTLETLNSFNSTKLCLGKQLTKIIAQDMAGSDFDGVAIVSGTAGGDITAQADWEAKAAAVDEDKIIAIPNISGVQFPAPTRQERTGIDAVNGVTEVTEVSYNITLNLTYLNAETFFQVAQMGCWPLMRVWLQDENGFVYGLVGNPNVGAGIPNVRFSFGGNTFPGTNQPNPQAIIVTMSWLNANLQPVSDTPLDFLDAVFTAPAP